MFSSDPYSCVPMSLVFSLWRDVDSKIASYIRDPIEIGLFPEDRKVQLVS